MFYCGGLLLGPQAPGAVLHLWSIGSLRWSTVAREGGRSYNGVSSLSGGPMSIPLCLILDGLLMETYVQDIRDGGPPWLVLPLPASLSLSLSQVWPHIWDAISSLHPWCLPLLHTAVWSSKDYSYWCVFHALIHHLLLSAFAALPWPFPRSRGPVFPGIPWAITRGIPGNTVLGGGAWLHGSGIVIQSARDMFHRHVRCNGKFYERGRTMK